MKKFLHELLLYFWIPLIVALVSYISFQLNDVTLGLITLVASTAIYAIARLYFMYKKWWLLVLLMVVVLGSVGIYFLKAPAFTLTINEQKITSTTLNLSEGTITIMPAPQGNGEYTKNTVVTLSAEPASGYDWIGWSGTNNDNVNPTTVTMSDDKAVKANFEARYSLIINNQQVIGSVVSFTEGSVTVDPPPSNADGKYSRGTTVHLTVHANTGYDWQSWTGTDNDTANPTTVTMNSGKQITLAFSGRFGLTINGETVTNNVVILPEGSISVAPAPDADGTYANGTEVTLKANPSQGYGWQSWSGTSSDTSNPTAVTLSSDKHVMIHWEQRYMAIINSQPLLHSSISLTGGIVTVNPAPGSDGSYAKNAKVVFTATPAAGYRFDHWGGDTSGTTNSIIVTFSSDKSIAVVFVKTYNLVAVASPGQGGSISNGSGTFDEGTTITLTATPAVGYRFDHWEGNASGKTPSISMMMNADKAVVAVFIKTYTLTVTVNPAVGGSVSNTGGTYDAGSNVTLTATPALGYRFDRWEGAATGNATSVSVTMDTDKSVTAVFIKKYTLTVTINPAEGGSISTVNSTYDAGAEVTVTATPATGYVFDHWEGDVTSTDATITITMDSDRDITAVFIPSA
ncbi:MAG: hypothetical protein ABR954_09650 [Dehalococcoidales bacterium]